MGYKGRISFSLKAFLGDKEERINLHLLSNKVIFNGLAYICTYSVEAFKELVHCEKLYVKAHPKTRQLYFTYGANIGFVLLKGIPQEPVISIVANSNGKIFPLLMEKSDIGKTTLFPAKVAPKKTFSRAASHKTYFWDYESEKMNDADNWEDQRLDAFEGDESNYWNIE